MDTLQTAYKILYSLEHKKKADYMGVLISPAKLGVPEDEWLDVIQALLDEGYIAGVKIQMGITGEQMVDIENARITLKGAGYLRENNAMRKFAKVAADVFTIIKH